MGPPVAIVAGAISLLVPALINGFPFVFPDSQDYLVFTPHLNRSPFYGLFIFFVHLNHFIWAPVLVQAIIASHLIWMLTRVHSAQPSYRWFALTVAVLCLFSSLPFFAGFIMADFFTAVMILCVYLVGFHLLELSRLERGYVVLLTCVAIAAHVSHLSLFLVLVGIVGALCLAFRLPPRLTLFRVGLLLVPAILVALAIILNNLVIHRFSACFPSGQSFLLANMIEYGPARLYLEKACPTAGYKICTISDHLPRTAFELLFATDAYQEAWRLCRHARRIEDHRLDHDEILPLGGRPYGNAYRRCFLDGTWAWG